MRLAVAPIADLSHTHPARFAFGCGGKTILPASGGGPALRPTTERRARDSDDEIERRVTTARTTMKHGLSSKREVRFAPINGTRHVRKVLADIAKDAASASLGYRRWHM